MRGILIALIESFQATLIHRHGENLSRLGDRVAGCAGDQQDRSSKANLVLVDRAAHRTAQHRGDQRRLVLQSRLRSDGGLE